MGAQKDTREKNTGDAGQAFTPEGHIKRCTRSVDDPRRSFDDIMWSQRNPEQHPASEEEK